MIVTKKCYENYLTYDNELYTYEYKDNNLKFWDKSSNTILFDAPYTILIKQINENEFISVEETSSQKNNLFLLKHIQYNKELNKINVIYKQDFHSKKSIEKLKVIDDIFIMEEYIKTIIYNPIKRKVLAINNLIIKEQDNELEDKYLTGRVKIIGDKYNIEQDTLIMYIDKNTLEFDKIYSVLQNRIIPIIQIENNKLEENYKYTIEKEVIKYIKILEEKEEVYKKYANNQGLKILKKQLTKKK